MTQETISWLARELHFPSIEERANGALAFNDAAEAALGDCSSTDLASALATLTGGGAEMTDIQTFLASARELGYASLAYPKGRILAFVTEANRIAAWVTADPRALAESLQARAAAADLAAGVSHEVSNALSAIIGWAQLSRERPDKAPPEEALTLVERSAQAARGATEDLLRMVRQHDHEPTRTNLSAVIQDVVRLLRPEAQKQRVQLQHNSEGVCWTVGTRSQLFSIVWNLAHNAVQLVHKGGEVRLTVREQDDSAELEVVDNGPGMSAEQRNQAFEPYFTTRSEGTGLGLSIVRGTVEALGGKIRLDTSPGDGARFHIQLPKADEDTPVVSTSKPAPRISRVLEPNQAVNSTVLVVEDDQGVRELIATTLALCDVKAVTFADASSALSAKHQRYSAAIIDLTLPDERGDRLLAALRERGDVQHAVIISGGPPPDGLDKDGTPDRWLRKPFDPSAIVVCVRELTELASSNEEQLAAS